MKTLKKLILIILLFNCGVVYSNVLFTNSIFYRTTQDSSLIENGWEKPDSCPFYSKSLSTSSAPKSCSFSPDGKYIYVTILNAPQIAVEIFSVDPFEKIRILKPGCEDKSKDKGYPEGRFFEKDSTFWFTRMTTGEFFVYHFDEDSLEKARNANGVWTKVVEFSPNQKYAVFSHWVSDKISLFDAEKRNFICDVKTKKTPRGMAWMGSDTIAVASFDEYDVEIFEISTGELLHSIHIDNAAMRDVHYDTIRKLLYYNDMRHAMVYKYDWRNKRLLAEQKVFSHPNTMKLTPDSKYLYVSSRGPNNPKGYIYPSLVNGKIQIISTSSFEIISQWEQGNQPTGLDISPDGKYLVTTDFSDNRVNLYMISELKE